MLQQYNRRRYRYPAYATMAGALYRGYQSYNQGYKSADKVLPRLRRIPAKKKEPVKVKSNQKLSKDVSGMRVQLKKLKKMDDQTTGTLTYRSGGTAAIKSNNNAQAVRASAFTQTSALESVLGQCKFFDPATPGTLITGNPSSGTFQRNLMFENITHKQIMRNNYQVPAEVTVYLAIVRDDTDLGVDGAWTNGIPDGSNLVANTDLNQYPTDYNLVNDIFKMKRIFHKILQPGQQASVSHSTGAFEYDPSVVDTHALAYQREYKAFQMLTIVKGVIAHDSGVSATQGITQAGVDIEETAVYKVKYSAGINIAYTYVSNVYDTFTGSALVSNKPISDNQPYSVV